MSKTQARQIRLSSTEMDSGGNAATLTRCNLCGVSEFASAALPVDLLGREGFGGWADLGPDFELLASFLTGLDADFVVRAGIRGALFTITRHQPGSGAGRSGRQRDTGASTRRRSRSRMASIARTPPRCRTAHVLGRRAAPYCGSATSGNGVSCEESCQYRTLGLYLPKPTIL